MQRTNMNSSVYMVNLNVCWAVFGNWSM